MWCRMPVPASLSTMRLRKWARFRDGAWMAIMGCGGLGMNAVAIARALGVTNVIAIDIDDAKLEAALEMGAAKALNAGCDDAVAQLQDMSEGRLMGVIDTFGGCLNRPHRRARAGQGGALHCRWAGGWRFQDAAGLVATKGHDSAREPRGELAAAKGNHRHGARGQDQADADRAATALGHQSSR